MRLLLLLLVLLFIIYYMNTIEHFSEDVNLDEKHQEIRDKIKTYNDEAAQLEQVTDYLKIKDIPSLQKNIDLNEPQLAPCKSKYDSRVDVIKKEELQKLAKNINECNMDKIKYAQQLVEYNKKIGAIKIDMQQIPPQIDILQATLTRLQKEYDDKQKVLTDLQSQQTNLQNELNSSKNRYYNCITSRTMLPGPK